MLEIMERGQEIKSIGFAKKVVSIVEITKE